MFISFHLLLLVYKISSVRFGELVIAFEYLVFVLTALENDWLEVMGNLCKAWKKWSRMSRILVKEGADVRMPGTSYKAVVQVVLIFRSEMWLLTPHMGQTLVGFQYRVAHQLTG